MIPQVWIPTPCSSLTDCVTPSVALLGWVSISPSVKCELTEIRLHPTVTSSERMNSSLSEQCQHSMHQQYVIITRHQAGCTSRLALLPLHPLQTPSSAFRTSKPLILLTCVMDRYPWYEAGTETKGTWETWVGLPLLWLQCALGQRDATSWSFFVLFPPKQVPFLPSHHSCATL